MSLPQSYTTPEAYFAELMQFLKDYYYLHSIMNTQIIIENVLSHIDIDNVENTDVFDKNFDLNKHTESNSYLANFFERLAKFQVEIDEKESSCAEVKGVKMCKKKAYEIEILAAEIAELCEDTGCDVVLDFGSGLGYLDQRIHSKSKLKILGIECDNYHVSKAKERQTLHHDNSLCDVKYMTHRVGRESKEVIEKGLKEFFGRYRGICIAGLHSCADLTIDALNLFLEMEKARSLIIVPCCYHKMALYEGSFRNFPLSSCLKGIHEEWKGHEFMNVPSLRLGAQRVEVNEPLEELVFNLLARAVLEVYAHNHKCKTKRNKRKAVKTKATNRDFKTYMENAVNGFSITDSEHNPKDFDTEEIFLIWRTIDATILKKSAIFVLLQSFLQPVIENFILYDRLVFLKENGVENCRFKKIFDKGISPRSNALIASKEREP